MYCCLIAFKSEKAVIEVRNTKSHLFLKVDGQFFPLGPIFGVEICQWEPLFPYTGSL